jgi:AraC-like DNA-binding protein
MGFDHEYLSQTHALHLHDYHGTLRLGPRAGPNFHDVPLTPGTLTLTPAGVPSSYDLRAPGTHYCVHFPPISPPSGEALAVTLSVTRSLTLRYAEAVHRFQHIIRCHTRAVTDRAADRTVFDSAASVALQELLVWAGLLDTESPRADVSAAARAVERVTAYIDQHLHEAMSADELARVAGLSQNYLARLFRREMGMTIPRFVAGRRVALAKLLLQTTDLPIKLIGARAGYPDPQHFNKLFRAVAGVSPSKYRSRKG